MRKSNAQRKAKRSVDRVIKTIEKKKKELEKVRKDHKYKPKIQRNKRR